MATHKTPGPLISDAVVPAALRNGTLCRGNSARPGTVGQEHNAQTLNVSDSDVDCLLAAAYRALPLMPEEIRLRVAAMLTPEAMAIIAGVGVVWAGSHFFGIGAAFDIVVAGVTVLTIGWDAIKAMKGFVNYYQLAVNARTKEDIDAAARSFADAVLTLAGAIGWTRLAKWLGSGTGGAKHLARAGAVRKSAAVLKRWRLFIDGIQFKVPRDQGMLWSKLGDAKAAEEMAARMNLTCLEAQLRKNGFFELYNREFGSAKNDITRQIWLWVSERYVQSLEGKVTAYVHRARHFEHLKMNAKNAGKTAGQDELEASHEFMKLINPGDPVIVHEINELSNTLLKNRKITDVTVIDVETGEAFGYRSRELLESLQRLEQKPTFLPHLP